MEWPQVEPKSNLSVAYIKDTELFTVQNFFTSVESKAFIEAAESIGFAHQGSYRKGEPHRDNHRISVEDPVLADSIWESGLNKLFSDIKFEGKAAVGLNPNMRFYRYEAGQCFGRHYDAIVDLEEGKTTYYTLLIYLCGGSKPKSQDSCETLVGGETVFYDPGSNVVAEVKPTEGMAVLHTQGDEYTLHEAQSVKKGVKYVLRSDVAFA